MLENIGILAIFIFTIAGVILILNYNDSDRKREQQSREWDVKNSLTLRNVVSNYELDVESGWRKRDLKELYREIDNLRKTNEIKEEINKTIETNKRAKERLDKLEFDLKSFAFKHREDIFKIFGEFNDITERELIYRIKYYYGLKSLNKSHNIIKEWVDGRLIEELSHEGETLFGVNSNLDYAGYKLNKEEMTRSEWLENQGLRLKPHSTTWDTLKLKNEEAHENAKKEEKERKIRNSEWF